MENVNQVVDKLTPAMRRVLTLTSRQLDLFDKDRPTIFISADHKVSSSTISMLRDRGIAGSLNCGNLTLTPLGIEVVKVVSNG